jgi:hypothetical protein
MIITDMKDPLFKRNLEVGIEMGTIVMVDHITDRVDIHLESLIKREITKFNDLKTIKFCRK